MKTTADYIGESIDFVEFVTAYVPPEERCDVARYGCDRCATLHLTSDRRDVYSAYESDILDLLVSSEWVDRSDNIQTIDCIVSNRVATAIEIVCMQLVGDV